MYTVVWLACAKALASHTAEKTQRMLSWQDMSTGRKLILPSKSQSIENTADLVTHGVEAIQKVILGGKGLQASAGSQICQPSPCRAGIAGKICFFFFCFKEHFFAPSAPLSHIKACLEECGIGLGDFLVEQSNHSVEVQRLVTLQGAVGGDLSEQPFCLCFSSLPFVGKLCSQNAPTAGLGYAVASALIKTAAQEQRGQKWQSLGLDANAASIQDCESSQVDEFGASLQSGIVYRPQLQPFHHEDASFAPDRSEGDVFCLQHYCRLSRSVRT